MTASPTFSFEFFPPASDSAEQALWQRVDELKALAPAFMTMTYGAGGSNRGRTVDLAIELARRSGRPAAAHLTFISTPRAELKALADRLWDNGVRHIVALRGDLPADGSQQMPDDRFAWTSDFVEEIRRWHDFEISVGAYPEKHPDASDMAADIEALRKKCAAGAARAITQFFFDNDLYFRFRDHVSATGIATPIVPGLLPIIDYEKMLRFATSCGASVPDFIRHRLEPLRDDKQGFAEAAAELAVCQTEQLVAGGVEHIHFYTLNKSTLPLLACGAYRS